MRESTSLGLETILRMLKLEPLPIEGGYFAVTYRSADSVDETTLPSQDLGKRPIGGAIYILETAEQFSAMHRLKTDELYFYHYGDPIELLLLGDAGRGEIRVLGTDLQAGQVPQITAPAGYWQGSRPVPGGSFGFSLASTAMAPAYMDGDAEFASRDHLVAAYPEHRTLIMALTRV